MAEQVVDIRQRIERMRTQIDDDVSNKSSLSESKVDTFPSQNNQLKENPDINRLNTKKNPIDDIAKTKPQLNQNKTMGTSDFEKVNVKSEYHQKVEENEKSNSIAHEKIEQSKKSFENYQLKNTVDSQNKKVEFDKVAEKFPQFSLNINNPISWKLMLLIMLMQLLTNIMLVVVLYLK